MASVGAGSSPGGSEADRRRARRQGGVVAGLFLTFVGAFLVSLEFPVGPSALEHTVPEIGAGLVALWLGGILMGRFSGQRVREGGGA